jgi:hypothetical protein
MGKGICREKDTAYVDYGKSALVPIPRWAYEGNRYQPLFQYLPSRAETLNQEA